MRASILLVALWLAACGSPPGTRAWLLSPPASEVRVVETPRGNHEVRISLTRLPAPQRYDAASSTFVVWIVPPEGAPIPVGEVDYDRRSGDGFASLLTPPYERFHVMVTAEPAHRPPERPGPAVVIAEELALG